MENLKVKLTKAKSKTKIILVIVAIILAILGIICIIQAFDFKENYRNDSRYPYREKHAYVGGDAYNYIINANYFTGYITLGSMCIICSAISTSTSLLLKSNSKIN